ncbi:MAG TPA: hypothetical protein VIF15_12405 [Polyangiaceae bacterium]|jgi:tetratricopeptide (TPR) repeat protein
MLRRLVLAAAVALALVASAQAGHADDDGRERSRAAFRRGVAQAHDGNYTAARDSFLEAYQLFPHPSILLNLGIARAHTGQYLEAEQDLVHFLADDGGAQADELASARAELAQVRGHLGTFRLHVAPDGARATLDAHPLALISGGSVDVRATRGAHDLHVEADGYAAVDRSIVVSGERASPVDVSLAPAGSATAAPGDGRRTAAWFLLGAGAVAAGVGVYAGVEAKSLADDYNTPHSGSFQDASTKARGLVFRTSADIAFIGALALGGAGAYFLLTSPASTPIQARLVLGPSWGGITGSF